MVIKNYHAIVFNLKINTENKKIIKIIDDQYFMKVVHPTTSV